MSLPEYVKTMLMDRGVLTSRMTGRKAQVRRCDRCGQAIVAGLTGYVLGEDVDVDPVPLTPEGERAAWAAGRICYSMTSGHGRIELDWRYEQWPTYNDRTYVVVEHDHSRIPDEWRAPARQRADKTRDLAW